MSLLQQAFVHRSYLNENPDFKLGSNERLEFLGDAFLSLVIAEFLYREFGDLSEGELTKLRSDLVRQDSLARLASSLGLGEYLYLGQGEEKGGGRKRSRNMACTLEALIGAAFVDQGFEATKDLVLRVFASSISRCEAEGAGQRLQVAGCRNSFRRRGRRDPHIVSSRLLDRTMTRRSG